MRFLSKRSADFFVDFLPHTEIVHLCFREFLHVLISFPKPIIAAVNGPAIGLGAAMLPLCDVVYASDKASFYMPYSRLGQTPEGCASYTFPNIMGTAMVRVLLIYTVQ